MPKLCRLLTLAWTAVLLAGVSAGPAGQATAKSSREGVYSRDQAARGQKIYRDKCAACHPIETFTDPVFLGAWSGQTAHALFTSIRTTMPQENPGGLRRQDYADLLAYLLQLNKLPAGSSDLASTDEALKKVVIEPPARQE